jgi:hypothetical protein
MRARAIVKRTLSPLNHHQNLASFGGTYIRILEIVSNNNFSYFFGNVIHLTTTATPQSITSIGVIANFNVSVVSVTNVDSHNQYPLSFFYNNYTPEFEKSQVNF